MSDDLTPLHGILERAPILATDPLQGVRDRASLAAISAQYALFSHGLFFTRLGMNEYRQDPVGEFIVLNGLPGDAIAKIDLSWPVFDGVATSVAEEHWDRRLIACNRAYWPQLWPRLNGVAVADSLNRTLHRPLMHMLKIVDQFAYAFQRVATPRLPTVVITVFGVQGDRHNLMFRQDTTTPRSRARVVPVAPSRRVLMDSQQYFAGNKDPFLTTPR